jgi:hypothetical protein
MGSIALLKQCTARILSVTLATNAITKISLQAIAKPTYGFI